VAEFMDGNEDAEDENASKDSYKHKSSFPSSFRDEVLRKAAGPGIGLPDLRNIRSGDVLVGFDGPPD
jgi:hypothetical protein